MNKIRYMLVVPLGAVMCAFVCLTGCERGDSASSQKPPEQASQPASQDPSQAPATPAAKKVLPRSQDPAYQGLLKENVNGKQRIMAERTKIESRIAQLRDHARKALPQGATDAQVNAELENNPKKYPAWRELNAALKANAAEFERSHAEARSLVRQRIQREVAERANSSASDKK